MRRCQSTESGESHECSESGDGNGTITVVEDLAAKVRELSVSSALKEGPFVDERSDFAELGPDIDPFKTVELK
jgi:hypothetical protein